MEVIGRLSGSGGNRDFTSPSRRKPEGQTKEDDGITRMRNGVGIGFTSRVMAARGVGDMAWRRGYVNTWLC
jgi:hypothetical protein